MSGSPAAVLVVGAHSWRNWVRYTLESEYVTPADGWSVEAANPTLAQLAALSPGQPVQLLVGDQVALKGHLERVGISRTRQGGTVVQLSGRDLAGPLLDCSPAASWRWQNLSLAAVTRKALDELGVVATVSAHADATAQRPLIKAEPGETYWQVIDRYAKKVRLMPWMSPAGVLNLTRPDYTSAPVAHLVNGRVGSRAQATNVLDGSYSDDITGRYSDVTVIGQAKGSDDAYGEAACKLKGSARDAGIVAKGLYRPTTIDEGELRSTTEAKARAAWEVSQRQHDAEQLQYVVAGHGPTTTTLWAPNQQVTVEDEVAGVDGTWWVAGRTLTRDRSGGTRTTLSLRRPNTLLPAVV